MADLRQLKTTLAYARLGLVSLSAAVVPITGAAQELCGTELFEGEPDAAGLMNETIAFLDVLESNGVVAFDGVEGRLSIDSARRALRQGVGSASLLACVVNADTVEFSGTSGNRVVSCRGVAGSSVFGSGVSTTGSSAARLFCTTEVATVSQFLGSES